jgi:hypothetical protein
MPGSYAYALSSAGLLRTCVPLIDRSCALICLFLLVTVGLYCTFEHRDLIDVHAARSPSHDFATAVFVCVEELQQLIRCLLQLVHATVARARCSSVFLYTGLGTLLLPSLDRVGDRPGSAGQVMNGGARLVYVRLQH